MPRQFWGEAAGQEFARNVEMLIYKTGGPETLVQRMHELGMGKLADSWISKGPIETINGAQLHELFGTGVLRALAAKLDLQPRDLVRQLSLVLGKTLAQIATGKSPQRRR
jgi:uncharacterized protein YidB (DUF937 family)